MPESALFHNDSDRHPVPPAVYLPPASHPSQPAAYVHQQHQTSYIPPSTAHPMPPESYAHSYAQMPPPNMQFTTPPYHMSTAEYPYQAVHTAYSSLPSASNISMANNLYGQQSLSDHVSATGYYTAPYYAAHQIGMHPVDPPRSHYLGTTSERYAFMVLVLPVCQFYNVLAVSPNRIKLYLACRPMLTTLMSQNYVVQLLDIV